MKPVERILQGLEACGCPPKLCSGGWAARCPAHDDKRPSLTVAEGSDGTVLVKCHAGCDTAKVVQALGLQLRDLFPPKDGPATAMKPSAPQGGDCAPAAGERFRTEDLAVAALERKYGKPARTWNYTDADAQLVGLVLRFDGPQGKTYRPVSKHPDGWRIAAMPEPRPLYRLPELTRAELVIVCEGEKAADAAWSLGFVATTSAGGAQAPGKTDWQPLAGKEVWILPDHDLPGRKYAETVAGILAGLNPPATVRIVQLPDLPEGGDIVDWIDAHGEAAEPASMRAEIEQLAGEVPAWQPPADLPKQPTAATQQPLPRDEVARIVASAGRYPPGEKKPPSVPEILPYCPPPLDLLPELMREYVSASARAIHCDPGYVLLPVLVTLAGAIGGNARRLELKPGWQVPPILWGAIVGESGTGKTPALQHVLRPIRKMQQQAFEHYDNLFKRYETELAGWEKDKAAWRSDKKTHEPPPEKPQPPVAERILVSDTTVEALAPILRENPRGVLLARDELAAWISSFDRYANKGRVSTDAANWLSVFNAETITVDRKTGTHRTLHIPRAAVSVIGGIQPGILRRVLGREHREAGLLARLLLVWPPRKPLEWTEDAISGRLEADFADLLQQLRELPLTIADNGQPRPLVVQLTPEAKALWGAFYNAHNAEQADLIGGLTSAWAKLEQYAARLALVIHYVRWAAGEVADELQLDRESMAAGIALTDWFKHETRRVYSRLDEAEQEQEQRELIEWIERRGGTVTAREVQTNYRPLRKPGAAEVALDDLVQAGLGEWEQCPASPQGGRPTRRFRLLPAQPADQPLSTPDGLSAKPPSEAGACQRNLKISAENGVSLTVDSVDSPQAGGQPPPGDGTPTKGAVRQPTLQATVTWLRTSLETGPQPVAELLKWWTDRGYNPELVYQARERLGVIEYCLSPALGACWRLPD